MVEKQLERLENYLKTDVRYLLHGGSWLSLGEGVGSLLSFVLAIAFANFLSPETYGVYKYILSVSSLIGAFALTGMPIALKRLTAKEGPGTLRKAVWLNLLWSLLPLAITLGTILYYYLKGELDLVLGLCFALLSPLSVTLGLIFPYLIGLKNFALATKIDTLRNIAATLIMLGVIYTFDNPIVVVAGYFVSQFTFLLLSYLYVRKMDHGTVNPAADNLHNYSIHLSLMGALRKVAENADSVLLFHFMGPAALSVYTFALAPVREMQRVNALLKNLLAPKLSVRPLSELKHSLPRKALLAFLVFAAMVLAYIQITPYLFHIIFPQYQDSVIFTQVLSVILLATPFILFSEALVAHAKTKALYIQQLVTPIIRLILLVILLPMYGLWGAVFTLVITRAINSGLAIYYFYVSED